MTRTCPACGGSGRVRFNAFRTVACHPCAGRGIVVVVREAKITHALILCALALVLMGCGKEGPIQINVPDPATACRDACLAAQLAGAKPPAVNTCLLACDGQTPAPTAATPSPSPSPTAAPTSAPAVETAVPIGGTCQETHTGATPKAFFSGAVEKAERDWIDANPDKWRGVAAEHRVLPEFVPRYDSDIVRAVRASGLDAAIEADGFGGSNGSIAVAARGDASFHEGYSIRVSSGDVRFPFNGNAPNGFMGRCEPRGFDVGGSAATPAPTPAATASPVAQATCPPLWFITAAMKGDRQQFQAGPGWLIDATPRFLINGKDRPCNDEHPECGDAGLAAGFKGQACEPAPEALAIAYESAAYTTTLDGYAGKVIGPIGSPFTVTVRLRVNAVDKAGRPMDLSHFYPFKLTGAI